MPKAPTFMGLRATRGRRYPSTFQEAFQIFRDATVAGPVNPPSAPPGVTVPSVEAFPAFSRRLLKTNTVQNRDGLLWPVGGPSSGPPGAGPVSFGLSGVLPRIPGSHRTVDGSILFRVWGSRRLDARNASTDGTVAPRRLGRSPVACRGSSLGPPRGHRAVGGSAWGPPYRRWKRSCSCF